MSAQTGYRPDLLDIDLGIDTVGEAEVFASIRDAYNVERDDAFKLATTPHRQDGAAYARWPRDALWRCRRPRPAPAVVTPRGAGADAGVVDESGRARLGGYRTIDLRGGLDPSALEPICSATSGS